MALVDSLETRLLRAPRRGGRVAGRRAKRSAQVEARGRSSREPAPPIEAARARGRLQASAAEAARRTSESASREQALAVENAHLTADVAKLQATLDAMNRSLAWRLFTPWWKFKELLKR